MALITAYSWIFSMITLNHGIITVNSFGILGLFEIGLDLLMNNMDSQTPNLDDPSDDYETEGMIMANLSSKIDNIEKTILKSEKRIIEKLTYEIKYNSAIRDFSKAVTYINHMYKLFRVYKVGYEDRTIEDLAKLCVTAGDNGLTYKLHDLVEILSPSLEQITSLFELVTEPYKPTARAAERCDETTSLQQDLLDMYDEVAMYIVKGYNVISHAYTLLHKLGKGKFRKEKELIIVMYERSMRRITKSAASALRGVPRDIRSCDPEYDEEDGTYIELKWLFNPLIIGSEFLTKPGWDSRDVCAEQECEFFDRAYFEPHDIQYFDQYTKCPGQLYNCSKANEHYYCPGTASGRRYDDLLKLDTDAGTCDEPLSVTKNYPKVTVNERYTCTLCVCYCDSKVHLATLRKFSLSRQEANTNENMIITGLRFVEKYEMIHIEIQQGKLEPNGSIDESTVHWLRIERKSPSWFWSVKWDDKSVHLDTLVAPPGQVMTGIQFSQHDSGNLELSIMTHEYDYSEGVILGTEGSWISSLIADRTRIELEEPDTPIYADDENLVNIENNKYIDFQMTDWTKNLSQTAIPFLDAQEIISDPPRPLSGAGLYYKGQEGYGGFIGLKLIAYDYAEVLAAAYSEKFSRD